MSFMKPPFSWLWAVHEIGGFFILLDPSNFVSPPAKPRGYPGEIKIFQIFISCLLVHLVNFLIFSKYFVCSFLVECILFDIARSVAEESVFSWKWASNVSFLSFSAKNTRTMFRSSIRAEVAMIGLSDFEFFRVCRGCQCPPEKSLFPGQGAYPQSLANEHIGIP